MMNRVPCKNMGFTLIEIMVSVAILSISLIALMGFSGNTLIKSGRAEQMTIAVMLARQKMTDIELELQKAMKKNEFPDEKSEDGKFDEPYEDYTWAMEIRRVELPPPVQGDEGGQIQGMVAKQLTKEISKTVRELKLTVKWDEMDDEQSVEVVTHIVKL
jgi:type II secretion system protein I